MCQYILELVWLQTVLYRPFSHSHHLIKLPSSIKCSRISKLIVYRSPKRKRIDRKFVAGKVMHQSKRKKFNPIQKRRVISLLLCVLFSIVHSSSCDMNLHFEIHTIHFVLRSPSEESRKNGEIAQVATQPPIKYLSSSDEGSPKKCDPTPKPTMFVEHRKRPNNRK